MVPPPLSVDGPAPAPDPLPTTPGLSIVPPLPATDSPADLPRSPYTSSTFIGSQEVKKPDDLALLQGKWTCLEEEGNKLDDGQEVMEIVRDVILKSNDTVGGRIKLDPSASPKRIDWSLVPSLKINFDDAVQTSPEKESKLSDEDQKLRTEIRDLRKRLEELEKNSKMP